MLFISAWKSPRDEKNCAWIDTFNQSLRTIGDDNQLSLDLILQIGKMT